MGLLDALNDATMPKLRLILYIALIFFSFFIFIGVAVMKDKVNVCPLYCDNSGCGGASNCNYAMAISIMFQLLYGLSRVAILLLLIIGKLTPDTFIFSNIMETVYLAIDMLATLLTFIAACILSAGHNASSDLINVNNWKSPSKAAQAGAWISVFLWIFLALIGFLYMMRAGKLPFGGSRAPAANTGGADTTPGGNAPHMEPPAYSPDDSQPKY